MMKRRIAALLLALAAALSLVACGGAQSAQPAQPAQPAQGDQGAPGAEAAQPAAQPQPSAQPEKAAITVTDMAGRTVTLDEPAERVVALSASDCEFLFAVGAGDTLVGRGEYCDYPEAVFAVPSVQSGYDTNIEQIIALEPQVLLMSAMAQTQEQIDALEAAGVRVVVSDAQDIESVYTALRMIGTLMGREENAAAVIDGMKNAFAQVSENPDAAGKSVYFEVSPLQYGLWTAGKGTFMNEIAEMVGLKNVFDDVEGWGEISEEQVLARNPDFIVTITMYFGEGPTPIEEILARPGWENVSAVQNAAILNLQNNELSRPTPRLADGARMLYDFVTEHAADQMAPAA